MKTKLREGAFYCSIALCAAIATAFVFHASAQQKTKGKAMSDIRLMTLDPGHFHAALVQKETLPGVSPQVHVYAPLGFDLIEHLKRVAGYNTRKENPTSWELEVHTGGDFLARMLRERPGNVVVIAGRNQGKIDRIKTCVENGLNTLVDKPWIIDAGDFPKLEATLNTAEAKKLIAYDIMTERSEITTILQRELINDAGVFGTIQKGSEADPAVYMESVHHLLKVVSGAPNIRPAWFFDVKQQGEGVADVGTHLVDLAQWMLFPEQAIDYRKDVNVLSGKRWPTPITKDEFNRVTNEPNFPDYLAGNVKDDKLEYYCNGSMTYALRGVHVKLDVIWNYEAPAGGGDTHLAWFKGSKSRIEVRQAQTHTLYVVPNEPSLKSGVMAALQKKVAELQSKYPGV
ncbi:MAG TPA: putative oxidoreductase C-terminal domain-containing protein, partial [Blastocatellia bacterium]